MSSTVSVIRVAVRQRTFSSAPSTNRCRQHQTGTFAPALGAATQYRVHARQHSTSHDPARGTTVPPATAASSPAAQTQTRPISTSSPNAKAVPFALNSYGAKQEEGPMLRMLMFGKPGAGKGTLSAKLVKKYDISFLSAGDLLRKEIADRTEVGRVAEEIVAHGGLVSDDIMLRVITGRLDSQRNKHWILDGFPRTLGQGELLDAHLRGANANLTLIVNLDVPDDVILSRISDRWVHLPSGRVYNLSYNAPRIAGRDDETGEPLTKRPDDNPEIFSRRLKAFYESTTPLLTYYSSRTSNSTTRMVTLSGTTSDEIWPQLEAVVQRHFKIKPRLPQTSVREAVMMRGVERDTTSSTLRTTVTSIDQ